MDEKIDTWECMEKKRTGQDRGKEKRKGWMLEIHCREMNRISNDDEKTKKKKKECVATSGTSKIQVWVDFFLS